MTTITIALSRGRIFDETLPLLAAAGIVPAENPETSRKLIIATNRPNVRVVIVRATDVPTYVQYGAADIGVAGKDVLIEHGGQGLYGGGVELLGAPCRRLPALPWPNELANRVVVVSTGHTEQHGYHLPLSTDTLIVQAIADGLAVRAPAEVWCLPAWPYGVSTHTREFPGTLNLGGRIFEDFFLAIVDRLATLGVETILFSNGHGGNHSFLVNVVKLAGERHPHRFVATEWLHTTGPALRRYRETALGGMGHGGELETSYILHLRPDLVHMEPATTEIDFVTTANYAMDWVESGRLIANPPWSDDTVSGLYGDGRQGTAEKGRLWLEAAVEEKLETVREIREQHTLRQIKRAWRAATAGLET